MKPTHRLKMLNKTTSAKGELGAGCLNEDGSITIVLNQCIVVQQDPNIVITLVPITDK